MTSSAIGYCTALQYVQCNLLANCTGKLLGFFQPFITVRLATVTF